jgi:hypothetical protein
MTKNSGKQTKDGGGEKASWKALLTADAFKALQDAASDLSDGEGHFLEEQLQASDALAMLARNAGESATLVDLEQMGAALSVLIDAVRHYRECVEVFEKAAWPWIREGEAAVQARGKAGPAATRKAA